MRGPLAWWRRRQQATALATVEAAEREARRRYISDLAEQRAALQQRATALFRAATREAAFADRHTLYCHALAADARAESLWWLMGGDAEAAAKRVVEAERYEALAGAPRPVPCNAVEAAHA